MVIMVMIIDHNDDVDYDDVDDGDDDEPFRECYNYHSFGERPLCLSQDLLDARTVIKMTMMQVRSIDGMHTIP